MPRSSGYRPKAAVREEVLELRALLATLREVEWVKAGIVMQRITSLLGHSYGPMNGKIQPRACRYCHYYGHTRQWCPARIDADEAAKQRLLDEDEKLRQYCETIERPTEPYDATKTPQARVFDELGIPYSVHKSCGPVVGARGDTHAGKWTFDASGVVVPMTTL